MGKRGKKRNGERGAAAIPPEVEAFLPPPELGPEFELLNARLDRTLELIAEVVDDHRRVCTQAMTAHAERLGERLQLTRTRIDEYQTALARLEARVAALDALLGGRAGPLPAARGDAEAALIDLLRGRGLEVVDRRKSGGALWVVGGAELAEVMSGINALGIATFVPAKTGGTTTGNRPGWFARTAG